MYAFRHFPYEKKLIFSAFDLKTALKDDFSSNGCSASRYIISNDGNKTTQVESIESNSQPETTDRLSKTLFHD